METREQTMRYLEEHIPDLAGGSDRWTHVGNEIRADAAMVQAGLVG